MPLFRAVALALVTFVASVHPAAATLLISFTATPSLLEVGHSATLHLLLTPLFDKPLDTFGLGEISFESGDGQVTSDLSPGGLLLGPLDLQHTFTYLTSGIFTATASGAISESFFDPDVGAFVIADYFFGFGGVEPLMTEVEVVSQIPEPTTLALFGTSMLLWMLFRRRNAYVWLPSGAVGIRHLEPMHVSAAPS